MGLPVFYCACHSQARYIAEEVKDKSNKEIDTSTWHEELVDDIPLQQNGYVLHVLMIISCINSVLWNSITFNSLNHDLLGIIMC